MVSFGSVVLFFTILAKFLCKEQHNGAILGCGSLMTFSASFLPLLIALITYYLPLEKDMMREYRIPDESPLFRQSHTSLRGPYNATKPCDPYDCLELLEKCALLQMIVIILSIANGVSLNTLAVAEEYSDLVN